MSKGTTNIDLQLKKQSLAKVQRTVVVKELAIKYNVSLALVYAAIRGDRDSELCATIKKEYTQKTKSL